MPKKETLTGRVSYRLTADELKDVRRLTGGKISADEWCRQAAREKLAVMRPRLEERQEHPEGHETLISYGRRLERTIEADRQMSRTILGERQPAQSQPAPPAQPAPAPNLGPIMNQNQAIFEEVLRLKFMLRQLATRHVQKNLDHRMWESIELNSEGNIFREVAAQWAQRYGMKIKY